MVRFSNSLVGLLNLVTFVLSAAILGGGIWLATKADTDCEKFLQWPLIVIGGFLIIVSLAGLVGACCRVTWLLWLYSAAMFLLILVLFCFTIFAFVITNKGAGRAVSGRGYKEYRVGDYSNWLQKRVEKSSNWNTIKSCIGDAKICKKIADDSANEVAEEFYKKNLSPTQTATSGAIFQDQLCYECDSCKAGVLANLKHDWCMIAILNLIVLVALIVVYSIGCCAFRHTRRDDHNRK